MANIGLADRVDRYLRTSGVKRLRGSKIGPSEISSSCPRQIVLGRDPAAVSLAPDEKLEDVSARLEGTALHRYFQEEVLPEIQGLEIVACEKWIESDYVNGSIDAIVKETETGETRILEIKTVKQAKFDEMREKGAPKIEYIEQMLLYMDHEGINNGEIFVINRGLFEDKKIRRATAEIEPELDDLMFLSFMVSLNDTASREILNEVKERVERYYNLLVEHEENGVIPEIPADAAPNAFPCLWCKFKHYCWPKAYQTVNVSELPIEDAEEISSLFSNYIKAKRAYTEAASKLDKSGAAVKRFFRQHTELNAWAVNGKNFTLATDGEIYLLRGVKTIDHRIRDEAPPERKNTMKAKIKRKAPKQGKMVVCNSAPMPEESTSQSSLFSESELEDRVSSATDAGNEFLDEILRGCSYSGSES